MNRVVYIVDDDDSVRQSTSVLVEVNFPVRVESYASGDSFLASGRILQNACLILDMRMPGMCASDVLDALQVRGLNLPTILISGHSDSLPSSCKLPANVLGFLEKPARSEELFDLIGKALDEEITTGNVE